MNTLPPVITNGILLQYADDTTLICFGSSPSEVATILNHQLSLVNRWLVNSRMKLNSSKSCVMWFSTRRQKSQHPPPDIVINHLTLPMTNKQKYLGLVFDSQLTWSDQVSNMCTKMSYYLHLIYTNKFVLPDNIIKLLLESLVMSHLIYALPVWGTSLTQQSISRIQRLHNRVVRLLYHLNKY